MIFVNIIFGTICIWGYSKNKNYHLLLKVIVKCVFKNGGAYIIVADITTSTFSTVTNLRPYSIDSKNWSQKVMKKWKDLELKKWWKFYRNSKQKLYQTEKYPTLIKWWKLSLKCLFAWFQEMESFWMPANLSENE